MAFIEKAKHVLYSKAIQIIAGVVVIGAMVGAGAWVYIQKTTPEFYDPDTHVSFRYSNKLVGQRAYDEKDKQDKIIYRLKNGEKISEPILVTVKYENGLRKVSSVLRYDIVDILLDNADKLFAKQYIKYAKESERKFTTDSGNKAAELTFSYLSPLGYFIKSRMVIVMRDEDEAIYVSAQTGQKTFDATNKHYFEKIFTSIDFKNL
ncbi:MAG: hypothetical protein Q8P56_04520 [Candidatus Uhrbacteria bacterium]|nr:hypothetical protein [Candidatus Uhrbacteria bacterium]